MLKIFLKLTFVFLFINLNIYAHQLPGLSSINVFLKKDETLIKLILAKKDIEFLLSEREKNEYFQLQKINNYFEKIITENIKLEIDGRVLPGNRFHLFNLFRATAIVLHFPKCTNQNKILTIKSNLINFLPKEHKQRIIVHNGIGKIIDEKQISLTDKNLSIDLKNVKEVSFFNAFYDFFVMGLEHIFTGFDHILFLISLLLVIHNSKEAIKLITFFTFAHAITISLSATRLFLVTPAIVEPFIAASIFYVGIENIFRKNPPSWRHWLTFAFGLVHGFGFSQALRDMDLQSGDYGVVAPIFSFSVGIETGQSLITLAFLPIIWKLNKFKNFSRKFLIISSLIVSIISLFWFIERIQTNKLKEGEFIFQGQWINYFK